MTISSAIRKAGPFTGNGVTVAFPFTFKVFAVTDLVVTQAVTATGAETTLALTTNYTVALNADQNANPGGTVTMLVAPAATTTLTLTTSLAYLQPTDLTNQGGFYPAVINTALDRLTIFVQQLAEALGRSLKTAISTPAGVSSTLPAPVPYQLIGWNATGTGFQNTDPTYSTALATDLAASGGAAKVGGAEQVVSSISALRLLLKTSPSKNAYVTGYYAAGDGGGGAYYYDSTDSTTADNGGSVIVAADGGRWKLSSILALSVKQFGAKGDGSGDGVSGTDDRVAIQAAISALPVGGRLYIPKSAGYYMMSKGSGSYCLIITKPIHIEGDSFYAALCPYTSVASSVNTIYIQPDTGYAVNRLTIEGLTLGNPNNGTRAGNHGIYIDTQISGAYLAKPIIRDNAILQGSGNAVAHLNNAANNINGGMYCASIENNELKGGINLQASGDSNTIYKNIIAGSGIGIFASIISGASLLTIRDNNITALGGAVKIDAGSRTKITGNNIEQISAITGGGLYMVDFSGANGTMSTCEITGNHFGAFTGAGTTANIRLANCLNPLVENNVLLSGTASSTAIVVSSNCNSARIGMNTYGVNITTQVNDAGTATIGTKRTLTLQNSWVQQTGFPVPTVTKSDTGIVSIQAVIANGVATAGTVIATLPVDYRPLVGITLPVVTNNGGTLTPGYVAINSVSGNITIQGGANGQMDLVVSFPGINAASFVSDL